MARTFNDASSQYLSVASAPATAAPLTISLWFNTDDAATNQVPVCLAKDSTNYFAVNLDAKGTDLQVEAYTQSTAEGDAWATATVNANPNVWNHACAVYSASNSRAVYLNGGAKGTDSTDVTPDTPTLVNIGRYIGGTLYFSGSIAEVAIWDAALSDEEVAALAEGYSPLLVKPGNLVAYWSLIRDEDQDRVGGHDLTANGGPTVGDHPPVLYPAPPSFPPPEGAAAASFTADSTIKKAQSGSITADAAITAAIGTGDLSYGGAVVETSGGVKYAVFVDGNTIEVWKNADGTPTMEDSASAATVHGGGNIAWVHAAIDSADDIHVVSACDSEQTRDIAYAVYDCGLDSFGAWEQAADYDEQQPATPGCHISIDASNVPHVVYADNEKIAGTATDQVRYVYKNGSWSAAEEVNAVKTKGQPYTGVPYLCHCPNDDIEAFYYYSYVGDPANRRRNGSWGSETLYTETSAVTGPVLCTTGDAVYRYHTSDAQDIEENDVDTGYNTHATLNRVSAALDGTDRYVFYIDTSEDVHLISNTGAGWTDGGALQTGSYDDVIAEWAYNNENQSGEISYLYDDGTSVYYGSHALATTQTDTFTADSAVKAAQSGSVNADSVVKTAQSGSVTADSVIKSAGLSGSFTADSAIKAAQSGSFAADSAVKAAQSGSLTSDGVVKRTGLSGSVTADALVVITQSGSVTADGTIKRAGVSDSFTADGAIKAAQSGSATADSAIKRTGVSSTFAADGIIEAAQSGSVTSDATVRAAQSGSFTADSAIEQTGVAGSFTADSVVKRTGVAGSFTADAVVKEAGIAGSITADAAIAVAQSGSVTSDCIIKRIGVSDSFAADSVIEAAQSGSVTADASIVLAGLGGMFTANAAIKAAQTGSISADSAIKRTGISGSVTADAVIVISQSGGVTCDATVKAAASSGISADSAIRRVGLSGSFTADAAVEQAGVSGSLAADSVVKAPQSGSFASDAVVKRAGVPAGVTADSVIERIGIAGSLAADAVIERTGVSAGIASDAVVKRTGVSAIVTADAIIKRVGVSSSFTGDATVKRIGLSASFTADANISAAAAGGTFAADAVIRRTGVSGSLAAGAAIGAAQGASFVADAAIGAAQSGSLDASATVRAAQSASFAADSVIKRVGAAGSFVADAMVAVTRTGSISADADIATAAVTVTSIGPDLRVAGLKQPDGRAADLKTPAVHSVENLVPDARDTKEL